MTCTNDFANNPLGRVAEKNEVLDSNRSSSPLPPEANLPNERQTP